MPKYRIVFRRPAPSDTRPDAERKFIDVTTDQPDLSHALAWAYQQVTKTKDAALLAQIASVNVRAVRDGEPQGGNDA